MFHCFVRTRQTIVHSLQSCQNSRTDWEIGDARVLKQFVRFVHRIQFAIICSFIWCDALCGFGKKKRSTETRVARHIETNSFAMESQTELRVFVPNHFGLFVSAVVVFVLFIASICFLYSGCAIIAFCHIQIQNDCVFIVFCFFAAIR